MHHQVMYLGNVSEAHAAHIDDLKDGQKRLRKRKDGKCIVA